MDNKIISFRVDVKHLKVMLVKLGCIKHDEFNNNKLLIDIYNNEVTLIKRNLKQDVFSLVKKSHEEPLYQRNKEYLKNNYTSLIKYSLDDIA